MRIGSAEIAAHRDGISIKGPMIWMLRQLGEMTPDRAMTPGTMAWTSGRDYVLAGYASAPAFGWLASKANDRATQVAAGRAWVRLQLAASALGCRCSRTARTLQEYPEMEALRAAMRAETGVASDETLQMFFRLGYAADPGPSSRRAFDSFLKVVTEPPLAFRIVNWIGIIDQLASTKRTACCDRSDCSCRSSSMLNHFSHRPDEVKTRDLGRPGAAAAAARSHQDRAEAGRQGLAARTRAARATVRSKLLHLALLSGGPCQTSCRPSRRFRLVSSAPSPAGRRTIALRCSRCSTAVKVWFDQDRDRAPPQATRRQS